MTINTTALKGKLRAIGDGVIVTDMNFGDQKTTSGIFIASDNGKTRGIYPRWGKVYSKGPDNKGDYNIGDWVLVEHGRWTRGFEVESDEVRMIETESILGYASKKPNETYLGNEYSDGQHATVDPSSFIKI